MERKICGSKSCRRNKRRGSQCPFRPPVTREWNYDLNKQRRLRHLCHFCHVPLSTLSSLAALAFIGKDRFCAANGSYWKQVTCSPSRSFVGILHKGPVINYLSPEGLRRGRGGEVGWFDCVKIKPIDTLIRFFNIPMIPPGAHYPEPPYQLYPWVNPVPYLFIFRTVIRKGGFLNFPRKHADVRITP